MAFPHASPKPDLTRLSSRLLQVPPFRHQLEIKLLGWIEEILRQTKHPIKLRGMPYARYLLTSADGVDDIMSAPAPMAISSGTPQQTVLAKFTYRQDMRRGYWYVEHIKFSVRLGSMQQVALAANVQAEELAKQKRFLDAAEAEKKLHPKHAAFPIQNYGDSLYEIGNKGFDVLKGQLAVIHGMARKEASIPDNPYTPKEVAMGLAGGLVGELGKVGGEGAEKLAKVYDYTDKGISAVKRFTSIQEDVESIKKFNEDHTVLKGGKSLGDVIVERGIDVVADLPGVGTFVKGFAGMFYDFASANFAGEVTKIRCRIYIWYIAGFVSSLTSIVTELPVSDFDRKYYQFGAGQVKPLSTDLRVGVQLALMDWFANHNITGGWGNKQRETPLQWTSPEDFLAHWSPLLLAQTMTCMLCQSPYLLD